MFVEVLIPYEHVLTIPLQKNSRPEVFCKIGVLRYFTK